MPTNYRAKSIRIVVAILVLVIAAVYAVRYSNKHEAGVQDQSVTIAKKEIKEENLVAQLWQFQATVCLQ